MSSVNRFPSLSVPKAILYAGLAIGILDAIDALIAFKVFAGFDPVPIYQFVASGILGKSAFEGGTESFLLGVVIHFAIAFASAATYVLASQNFSVLRTKWIVFGFGFGVALYLFMSYVIIPVSKIAPSPFSLPLFINGILGHGLLVGLPAAFFATKAYQKEG